MKTKLIRMTPVTAERFAEICFAIRQKTGKKIAENTLFNRAVIDYFDNERYLDPKELQKLSTGSDLRDK